MPNHLINLITSIIHYEVDRRPILDVVLDGNELTINAARFAAELYSKCPEELEIKVKESILRKDLVIVLSSPFGWGKSSLISHTFSTLAASVPTLTQVYVDVKSTIQGLFDEGCTPAHVSRHLRNIIQNQLYPGTRVFNLLATLIAGPQEQTSDKLASVFASLSDETFPLLVKSGGHQISAIKERLAAVDRWLRLSADNYDAAHQVILPKVSTSHIVAAYLQASSAERIAVYIDNVDRCPPSVQLLFFEFAIDTTNAVGDAVSIIVSIRSENCSHLRRRQGSQGDIFERFDPTLIEYSRTSILSNSSKHFGNILQRRHQLIIEYLRGLTGPTIPKAEVLLYERLYALTQAAFLSHNVPLLSNGSMRQAAVIYTGFLEYLYEPKVARPGENYLNLAEMVFGGSSAGSSLTDDQAANLSTIFFMWLRQSQKIGTDLPNLVSDYTRVQPTRAFAELASLEHLLLTCVLNLTRVEADGRGDPQISTIYSKLVDIGFSSERIRGALQDSIAPVSQPPKLLEITPRSGLPDFSEHSTDQVHLTPLGRQLITYLFSRVGYVWGGLTPDLMRLIGGGGKTYHEMNSVERVHFFYRYCKKLANDHLVLMYTLSQQMRSATFLESYFEDFAVYDAGTGSQVQIERILDQATAFYRFHFRDESAFMRLKSSYRLILDEQISKKVGWNIIKASMEKLNAGDHLI